MAMDTNKLWEAVLSEVELQLSRPNFLTWLKNSHLVKIDDSEIAHIALPNHFAKEWVEAKYNKIILAALKDKSESVKKVKYIVESGLSKTEKESPKKEKEVTDKKQLIFQEMRVDSETNLNPRYTLASFVVGSSNELVYSASQAVIESIGTKYNPFFIYGGVGLGKTHLIQAIGNEITTRSNRKIKVKYVTSEKFTNEVVWGIRNRRMEDIKNTYRHVDVLIIDDIQFIGGKEKTEEEFFHTFNALYETNKQIIISSDRAPKSIPVLEERLRSRFEGGMIGDIGYPDYETRVAIIKTKLQERGVDMNEKIINFVAERAQRNVREIEGILNKLIFSQDTNKDFGLEETERIITEMTKTTSANISPNHIINAVAAFFEMSANDIISKARNKELIEPRQITIYLLRNILNMSYPYIANKIGNRDHTTAIYSYKKISDAMIKDQELNQKITSIKESLGKFG